GSAVLGEASVNVAEYGGVSKSAGKISLPLKRCGGHRSVVELKIECLNPRLSSSQEEKPEIVHEERRKSNASISLVDDDSIRSFDLLEGSVHGTVDYLLLDDPPPIEEQRRPMNLMEAVRLEAEMWQRNARRAMEELDESTEEFLDVSRNHLEPMLATIKRDVESEQRQIFAGGGGSSDSSVAQIQKSFESLIDGLNLRLKQNRESNSELVSVRREFKHAMEELLSSLKSDLEHMENSIAKSFQDNDDLRSQIHQLKESEKQLRAQLNSKSDETSSLKIKVRELENDCAELTNENLQLVFNLKDLSRAAQGKGYSSTTDDSTSPSDESDSEHLPEITEQLHIAFRLLGKPHDEEKGNGVGTVTLLKEMNKLLEIKIAESDEKGRIISDVEIKLGEERTELQELERLVAINQENYLSIVEELHSKERQNNLLLEHQRTLEAEISTLRLKVENSASGECVDETMDLLRMEMDLQILALRHVLKDVHEQLLEAQRDNQFLREEAEASQFCAERYEQENRRLKRENSRSHDQLKDAHRSQVSSLRARVDESESRVEKLMAQVDSSIRSHERLMSDHERTAQLLASYKRREGKLKDDVRELESKLAKTQEVIRDMEIKLQSAETRPCRSAVEVEELKERYLEMSLKYAEVEAQREQLVMKLKEFRSSDKRWFWKKH
ncbi:hypothetical protein M569_07633, partial [Genlisea aurea]